MLGERALDLVREAARSQDMLGPYNEDKVLLVYYIVATCGVTKYNPRLLYTIKIYFSIFRCDQYCKKFANCTNRMKQKSVKRHLRGQL